MTVATQFRFSLFGALFQELRPFQIFQGKSNYLEKYYLLCNFWTDNGREFLLLVSPPFLRIVIEMQPIYETLKFQNKWLKNKIRSICSNKLDYKAKAIEGKISESELFKVSKNLIFSPKYVQFCPQSNYMKKALISRRLFRITRTVNRGDFERF